MPKEMYVISVSTASAHGGMFITGQRFPSHPKTKAPTLFMLPLVHDYVSGPLRAFPIKTSVCADGNAHLAVDKQDQGTVGGHRCWPGKGCGPQRQSTSEDACQPAAVGSKSQASLLSRCTAGLLEEHCCPGPLCRRCLLTHTDWVVTIFY